MIRPGIRHAVMVGALAVTAVGVAAVAQRQPEFPHEAHANLFPLCEGCHQGVPVGDRSAFYPTPAQCSGCHDGTEQPRVDWQAPTERPDNVTFEHPEHPDTDGEGGVIDCASCHTAAGAPRMAVTQEAVVPRCLACHEHRAVDHYVDADCSTCHMPLADAPFDGARMAALPEPADHQVAAFLADVHGDLAREDITRCAVCHTRERCESCHVDAALVAAITALPAARGIVARDLPEFEASYPVPPSHLTPDFITDHGEFTAGGSCSACHTREDCASCHIAPRPSFIEAMLSRQDVQAPGVRLTGRAPASHQAPYFEIQHGNEAAAAGASCSACHTRTMCTDCHEAALTGAVQTGMPVAAPARVAGNVRTGGSPASNAGTVRGSAGLAGAHSRHVDPAALAVRMPAGAYAGSAGVAPDRAARADVQDTGRAAARRDDVRRESTPASFHPANFMARHSAEAYGRRLECSNCHDRRLFCADCHQSLGMSPGASPGRLGPGFHDAEPLWLLRHGQPARQALESCAACHAQNECMQCHSVLGAFKVSPHGPNFDARRAQSRNAAICLVCHITDPLNGRT
jgi:predicted CXXCH cytochrome family protein